MVTSSDTVPVQVEIFPSRFLTPKTAQHLLNQIYEVGGVKRILIQGPNQPRAVPYGPGRGTPIEEHKNLLLEIGGQALELKVKVGRIRLELEGEEHIDKIQAVCERALPFSFQIKRGRFFRDVSTITDYAKYGADIKDKRILGMVDPKARKGKGLAMLSEENVTLNKER
jgi:methyl-coenzyme M reductase subunit D